jgi:predicted nucleic acid-binding protein
VHCIGETVYLLDANLVSELRKVRSGKADPGVVAWADEVDPGSLFLSSITLHELELGVLLAERRDPTQGALLRHWLQQADVPAISGRNLADFATTGVPLLNPWELR